MNDDQVKDHIEETQDTPVTEEPEVVKVAENQNIGISENQTAEPEPQVEEQGNTIVGDAEEGNSEPTETKVEEAEKPENSDSSDIPSSDIPSNDVPGARWYVVHTYSGHENRVAAALKQRVDSEHLEHKIVDVLVPTQEKIEIRGGKKENVKEKIFPGYILVKMVLDDEAWLAVRTTQGVTSFVGMGNKPTAVPESEVKSIVTYMQQGAQPTYKMIFVEGDTVKIVDGPFAEFIGKVETVDKERGKVKVLVSIFGRETPVELDFLQVAKL